MLRDVEGVDVTFRLLIAGFFGQRYDRACNKEMKALWAMVEDDGCVMANPLTGQLEPEGWHVYVQLGGRGEEFLGTTLLEALQVAHEKVATWTSSNSSD